MLRGGAEAGAVHGADDERRHRLAAEHVAELGGLVEDLVEADAHEVDEHQLGDRAQAAVAAAPTAAPTKAISASGVSSTRLRPNLRVAGPW